MTDTPNAHPEPSGSKVVGVKWVVPPGTQPQFITNFTIQRLQHEYVLSFFQLIPPLIIGSPEQVNEQVGQLHTVEARCISQVVFALDRLPELAKVLENAGQLPVAFVPGNTDSPASSAKE